MSQQPLQTYRCLHPNCGAFHANVPKKPSNCGRFIHYECNNCTRTYDNSNVNCPDCKKGKLKAVYCQSKSFEVYEILKDTGKDPSLVHIHQRHHLSGIDAVKFFLGDRLEKAPTRKSRRQRRLDYLTLARSIKQ